MSCTDIPMLQRDVASPATAHRYSAAWHRMPALHTAPLQTAPLLGCAPLMLTLAFGGAHALCCFLSFLRRLLLLLLLRLLLLVPQCLPHHTSSLYQQVLHSQALCLQLLLLLLQVLQLSSQRALPCQSHS